MTDHRLHQATILTVLAGILALLVAVPLNIQASNNKLEDGGADKRAAAPAAKHHILDSGKAGLLCSTGRVHVLRVADQLAVAADESGHFTLYEAPDPKTGAPTSDSNELLRDCAPELAHYNLTTVETNAGSTTLGSETVSTKTKLQKVGSGPLGRALVTEHKLDSGLSVTQTLSLARRSSNRISNRISNGGFELRISHAIKADSSTGGLAVRQLLAPALQNRTAEGEETRFTVPGLKGRMNGERVPYEAVLARSRGEIPKAILAPRPAAATDSTSTWRSTGDLKPSHVTFAGWKDLTKTPGPYGIRLAWPLPPDAALAVEWRDLDLEGQDPTVLRQSYGPSPPTGTKSTGTTER